MQITLISHPYPYLTIEFADEKERKDLIHNIRANKVVGLPFGDGTIMPDKEIEHLKGYEKRSYKKRVCVVCNKEFTPHGPRQQKCDDCVVKTVEKMKKICDQAAKIEEPKLVLTKKCSVCGLDFETTDGRQRRCPDCKEKAKTKGYKPKICKECGREFTPTSGRSETCDACKMVKGQAKARTTTHPTKYEKPLRELTTPYRQVYDKSCFICHKHFQTDDNSQNYCPKCVAKAQSQPKIQPLPPEPEEREEPRKPLTDEDIAKLPEGVRQAFYRTCTPERKEAIEKMAREMRR